MNVRSAVVEMYEKEIKGGAIGSSRDSSSSKGSKIEFWELFWLFFNVFGLWI